MVQSLDFKVSTGLKDIIGKELITEAHTAVFELVKNAYDANATRVDIIFRNVAYPDAPTPSTILIVDNGDGMSYEDIKNKWLFVGYSKKKEEDVDKGGFQGQGPGQEQGDGRRKGDRKVLLGQAGVVSLICTPKRGQALSLVASGWTGTNSRTTKTRNSKA